MAKRMSIIPKAPVARILQNAGAKRVSASAVDAFADILEKIAEDICKDAAKIAKHSGRKTVHEEDIRLAARK